MADLRRATAQRACNCGNYPCASGNGGCSGGSTGGINNGVSFMPPIMPPAVVMPGCNGSAGVAQYPSVNNFPPIGNTGIIYVDSTNNTPYIWDGEKYVPLAGTAGNSNLEIYNDRDDFPIIGNPDTLYIDDSTHDMYYWDGIDYTKVNGSSQNNPSNPDDGDGCDDCCIWGDILNGGGPEDIAPDCPIEHHCGSCSGSGSASITADSIEKALGYTPAKSSALNDEIQARKILDDKVKTVERNVTTAKADAKTAKDYAIDAQKTAESADKKAAQAQKIAEVAAQKIAKLEKDLADQKKITTNLVNDVNDVKAKVMDFENDLKNVDDELDKAKEQIVNTQKALSDIQETLDEKTHGGAWELLETVTLSHDEVTIAFENLNCSKIYASCTLCGSDANDTHQRLEVRVNENNARHRIATLDRAVPASCRDTRYTNLYTHALNTHRMGGYIQKDSDYPDSNFILQSLSTRNAKDEEIDFGTKIDNLYFTTGNPEGKLGRGTKIVLYGIKSQE